MLGQQETEIARINSKYAIIKTKKRDKDASKKRKSRKQAQMDSSVSLKARKLLGIGNECKEPDAAGHEVDSTDADAENLITKNSEIKSKKRKVVLDLTEQVSVSQPHCQPPISLSASPAAAIAAFNSLA